MFLGRCWVRDEVVEPPFCHVSLSTRTVSSTRTNFSKWFRHNKRFWIIAPWRTFAPHPHHTLTLTSAPGSAPFPPYLMSTITKWDHFKYNNVVRHTEWMFVLPLHSVRWRYHICVVYRIPKDGCRLIVPPCRLVGFYRPFRGAKCVASIIKAIVLTMEVASTSETSVKFYQTTWHKNAEESHLHSQFRDNLKSLLDCYLTKLYKANVVAFTDTAVILYWECKNWRTNYKSGNSKFIAELLVSESRLSCTTKQNPTCRSHKYSDLHKREP
jgi:hypothetical protein